MTSNAHRVHTVDVTEISQAMKTDRNFLKWMMRRYKEVNPEQSAAFGTAAELTEKLRSRILAGDFDVSKDLFTGDELPDLRSRAAAVSDLQCPEFECIRPVNHTGLHMDQHGLYFDWSTDDQGH